MENASKALMIAGGALILILLFTVMNYVFRNMGSSSSEIYDTMSESEITEFNQQFLNYDGRTDLTIQDVVTIVNLAKDNNEKKSQPVVVTVTVMGRRWDEESAEELNAHLMEYSNHDIYSFSCQVNYAKNSKLVGDVIITKAN